MRFKLNSNACVIDIGCNCGARWLPSIMGTKPTRYSNRHTARSRRLPPHHPSSNHYPIPQSRLLPLSSSSTSNTSTSTSQASRRTSVRTTLRRPRSTITILVPVDLGHCSLGKHRIRRAARTRAHPRAPRHWPGCWMARAIRAPV